MHSYSQKCQSDQQRLEALIVTVFDSQISFFFISLFTWMCTHFVQNIAALFSLSLKLHYLPSFLYKDGFLCFRAPEIGRRLWAESERAISNIERIWSFQPQHRVQRRDCLAVVMRWAWKWVKTSGQRQHFNLQGGNIRLSQVSATGTNLCVIVYPVNY